MIACMACMSLGRRLQSNEKEAIEALQSYLFATASPAFQMRSPSLTAAESFRSAVPTLRGAPMGVRQPCTLQRQPARARSPTMYTVTLNNPDGDATFECS